MASSTIPLIEKLKEQFTGSSVRDYQKLMARRRVVDELSKLILSQPVESENESSSNLFKILVKRFKAQLGHAEKDPAVCDTAARKLAKFVETIMKEAYFTQRQKRRSSSIRSFSALPGKRDSGNRVRSVDGRLKRTNSKELSLEKDSIIKGLGFADSKTSSPVVIEKVPRSFARTVPKCGPLYTAKIGGRKVYVQEVKEGESKKALISRVNSESTDPNREWSSWMVDLANKTKEWIKWLDEKASVVENKKSGSESSHSPAHDSSASDDKVMSRGSGHERERREHDEPKVYHNVWRESSSESLLSNHLFRPSTANNNTRSIHQSRDQERCGRSGRDPHSFSHKLKESEINDFHFSPKPSTSKYGYAFASSKRRPSTSM